ncbi:MAG: hypothetical protein HYZ29_35685 [Myxococcales bacterium]|nr:hypothetical protein [Myxococcales bacterium]
MERIAKKLASFEEARAYELEQYRAMSVEERRRVARTLRVRHYGDRCPDVRSVFAGSRRRHAP